MNKQKKKWHMTKAAPAFDGGGAGCPSVCTHLDVVACWVCFFYIQFFDQHLEQKRKWHREGGQIPPTCL